MPRPDKVQAVEDIKQRFQNASAAFLTEYRGLPVARQQELRGALHEAGAGYKVLKMSLTRRALDELGMEGLDEWLTGPTAIAFTGDDPVPAARALADFAKANDAFLIKGGWFNGEAIPSEVVSRLANIDSREALLAKTAGAFKGPLNKMAAVMGSFTREAASLFSALLERKEEIPSEAAPVAGGSEEPAPPAEDAAPAPDVDSEPVPTAAAGEDDEADGAEGDDPDQITQDNQ